MKYYLNLIKNKKYVHLLIFFCIGIFGLFCFFYNVMDVTVNNIGEGNTNIYTITNTGIIGYLSITNLGMIFIGLLIAYFGFVWFPVNSAYAQDDSDYTVSSDDDNIYIKFRKNEFCVKKETFQPTDLFFRDKNHKFVSMTRGYQIYNYVCYKYKNDIEKKIENDKDILRKDVVKKFSNVKLLSQDEKQKYISNKQIKNRPRILFVILSILLWTNFLFWLLYFIFIFTGQIELEVSSFIVATLMVAVSYILGKKSNVAINKNKNLIKKIMNGNMYDIECSIFDKKNYVTSDANGITTEHYKIKLTNNNYVLNEWIEISKEKYENISNEKVHLLLLEENENDIFEIV